MAIIIPPDGSNEDYVLEADDVFEILPGYSFGGSVGVGGGSGETVTGIEIIVNGAWDAGDMNAVGLGYGQIGPNGNSLTVGPQGSITSSSGSTVSMGQGDTLVNKGTIGSSDPGLGYGITVLGDDFRFYNAGTVEATTLGFWQSGSGYAGFNSGEIVSGRVGVILEGGAGGFANTGLIDGTDFGVQVIGDGGTFFNSGTLVSEQYGALISGDNNRLYNTGTIEVTGSDPAAVAVDMDGENAYFQNAGTVVGDIVFGDGDDRYIGKAGSLDGVLRAGPGSDRLTGGDGGEVMNGQAGADTIRGRGGADELRGGAGNDTLDGGAGKDILRGGAGDDEMLGGRGADLFVFTGDAGDDVIRDFDPGRDRIDLSAYGTGFGAVLAAAEDTGKGVLIDLGALGGEGSVLLRDVEESELGAGDFLF